MYGWNGMIHIQSVTTEIALIMKASKIFRKLVP